MKILSHFTYATAAASSRGNGVAARRSFRPLYGESVRIVEVGPRDGLQNEPKFIESNVKIELIRRLLSAGAQTIEATAFVDPGRVPQFTDADEDSDPIIGLNLLNHSNDVVAVMVDCVYIEGYYTTTPSPFEVLSAARAELPRMNLNRAKWPVLQALVPNINGFERALKAGANEVYIRRVTDLIEYASPKERFRPVLKAAQEKNIPVRAYVSCSLGCPYQGVVPKMQVAVLVRELVSMGCYEVSIADTIGTGTPADVLSLLEAVVAEGTHVRQMAVHFHNTYGQGLANILAALEFGIRVVDSAIGGLGGCPFARGATGNVATEDVVYMLNGLGMKTGMDIDALVDTTIFLGDKVTKPPESSVAKAFHAKLENSR